MPVCGSIVILSCTQKESKLISASIILAPPRTWTAAYKSRLEGAVKLIQQEQVEEDKSKCATKATEIYHMGRMGTLADLNETIGNFYALMHCIIMVNPDFPPLIWTEIEKFDKILRTDVGRDWADLHRNIKEVLFKQCPAGYPIYHCGIRRCVLFSMTFFV